MIGKQFVSKCIDSRTINDPWPHQYIEDTLPQEEFIKLQEQCRNIDVPKDRLVHIFPKDFADHDIKFYDQIHDISKNILDNAKELAEILRDIPSKINLIPFNPFPGTEYKRPSNMRVETFKKILQKEGYITTVRTTRGEDIMAACGQLVGKVNDRTNRKERSAKENKIIETKSLV